MSPALLGPLNGENLVLSCMIGSIIVAASMIKEPNQGLPEIAEAGPIEEPTFRAIEERTTGIYNYTLKYPHPRTSVFIYNVHICVSINYSMPATFPGKGEVWSE